MTLVMGPSDIFPIRAPSPDAGQSPDAHQLRKMWQRLSESASRTGRLTEAIIALDRVAAEGAHPNWDGYGALAISDASYRRARLFLEVLPSTLPVPEIGVEPGGGLTFEWFFGLNGSFSIIIGSTYQLTYAGIFGAARVHGVEYFVDELPQSILANLRRAAREHR